MDAVEKLSREDFKELRDYIYDQSGLHFSDAKLYFLENRISRRLKALNQTSYRDYLAHIKKPIHKRELFSLFDAITTNETSFYRNPPQIDAFAKNILPAVVKKLKERGQRTLRIWSAACSSGEEPYTLAMILKDRQDLLQGLNATVYGTDISNEIIEQAKTAVYKPYTMRHLPNKFQDRYFTKQDKEFKVHDSVKSLVNISYFNLVDYAAYRRFRNMDIILCRNVLIYFDLKVKRNIIKGFWESLNKDGYLLIGHSESLHNINRDFKMQHYSRALAYLKES
ncbi:MAG: protein-glutamate O-methyltransferase CheR [Acidobacteriota bacterium]|nr:protein-glutamate O-methyltransferase CheR [Acidobacteriota bacterium]